MIKHLYFEGAIVVAVAKFLQRNREERPNWVEVVGDRWTLEHRGPSAVLTNPRQDKEWIGCSEHAFLVL